MLNCMQLCIFLIFVDTFCSTPWRPSWPSLTPFSSCLILSHCATSTLITLPPVPPPINNEIKVNSCCGARFVFPSLFHAAFFSNYDFKMLQMSSALHATVCALICVCEGGWGREYPSSANNSAYTYISFRCDILLSANCSAWRRILTVLIQINKQAVSIN